MKLTETIERTDKSLSDVTERLKEVKEKLAQKTVLTLSAKEVEDLEKERDDLKDTYCKL